MNDINHRMITCQQLTTALHQVGESLAVEHPNLGHIQVLLVGGAAGMLTQMLRPERTTTDCDVIEFIPKGVSTAVESVASKVAVDLGLSIDWFNSHATWYVGIMLEGWKQRRQHIGQFSSLDVYAVGRLDLIALKFYAHRDQDAEDLDDLKVNLEEAKAVKAHLQTCLDKGFTQEQINPAIEFLEAYIGI